MKFDSKKKIDQAAAVTALHQSQPEPHAESDDIDSAQFDVKLSGAPLELPMDLIDEDPQQPRTEDNPGFSNDSLAELAASILLRNVKTPISVRQNVKVLGRFIINHGARRFRASKRVGKRTIPGFIDNDYNEADQVVENLQRNQLTAREIANYIGRELAKGIKKSDIARTISKSPAFVTQHVVILDLPDPIAMAFNLGRVKDVTVIAELVKAFRKNPKEVSMWVNEESQEITRGAVKLLREFLDDKLSQAQDEFVGEADESIELGDEQSLNVQKNGVQRKNSYERKKTIVKVLHDRRTARLLLNRLPSFEGFAWLQYDDDGMQVEVDLSDVQLVALLAG